jgi:hypothetical protein
MSAVRTLFSKNRGRKAGESLVERYRAFGRVITRAAIVGVTVKVPTGPAVTVKDAKAESLAPRFVTTVTV